MSAHEDSLRAFDQMAREHAAKMAALKPPPKGQPPFRSLGDELGGHEGVMLTVAVQQAGKGRRDARKP